MKAVRWPWLIFAMLLAGGIIADSVTEQWSTESSLDLATYAVSSVSIVGVFLYAFRRSYLAAFWRAFRWLFAGVIALELLDHTIEVTKKGPYSDAGTVATFASLVVFIGWIYVLQWIAMSRLAKENDHSPPSLDQLHSTFAGSRQEPPGFQRFAWRKQGGGMQEQRDATGIIYAAGAVLILNGPMQLTLGHTLLGLLSIGVGLLLIVQRVLRNKGRPRG